MLRGLWLIAILLFTGCSHEVSQGQRAETADTSHADGGRASQDGPRPPDATPLNPPAPGERGGLPDDRRPVPEGPIDPKSAQGAAQVLQHYFALIEQDRYGDAYALWSDAGRASGMSAAAFAAGFDKYSDYHGNIGAPARMEGAAGSSYVEVPVQVYGRRRNRQPFVMIGTMTLRRINDVPGSTAAQRRWHIFRSNLHLVGSGEDALGARPSRR